MAAGPKTPLDVRLLGLDQKANPRTAVAGTIIDGRNFTMNKDGRVEKRLGSAALAMLDSSGDAITGTRELSHLDDELVISNGKKVRSREPNTGVWLDKGRPAYERLDIKSLLATISACDGTDSALQLDSAVAGNYALTVMAATGSERAAGNLSFLLSDRTTGEVVKSFSEGTGFFGPSIGTDGAASPVFILFAAYAGTLQAGVWDSTVQFFSLVELFDDLSTLPDPNTYGLQGYGSTGAPYAALRVAANTWLIAYQQETTGKLMVRRITRSTGTTFTVGTAVEVDDLSTDSAGAIGWAYATGAASAYLVATGDLPAPLNIVCATVAVADATVSDVDGASPNEWNTGSVQNARCLGVTGVYLDAAYFFFDVRPASGGRHVYLWSPVLADATLVFRDACLLTHAWLPSTRETAELGIGIGYLSDWQPSAFLMRLWCASQTWSKFAIGAHLQAGDFAGRPMCRQLPTMEFGAFPLGTLRNPPALGEAGTVLVKLATLGATSAATVSQPAQVGNTLVLPGACLKAYDGKHVTEAAFALGPETVTPTESTRGVAYHATSARVLSTDTPPLAATVLSESFTGGQAEFTLETAAGVPNDAGWPGGTVTLDCWVKILNPGVGQDYSVHGGDAPGALVYSSATGYAWQSNFPDDVAVTDQWTHVQFTLTAPALADTTAADRLIWVVRVLSTDAISETATAQLSVGSTMPATIYTPFPVIESGARQYCACAAWTDARGRIQRSQICPAVTLTTAAGLSTAVSVPMLNITERDPVSSLGGDITPAEIEIYRTAVNATTFYRVGKVTNDVNGAAVTFYDETPDTDITAFEQLYTTGNAVANWPPIGCNLAASHQGRLFVVTADNVVLFTAYLQDGEGLAFAAEYQVETQHVPGALTALLSLDDKLAICSRAGIASLVGIGPEVSGLPVYDSPMFIASGFGPVSQRACARTPNGWEIITPHGAYLLDRGLGLSWIGPQVNTDAPGSYTWTAAVYDPDGDQCRFSTTGLVVVHDLTLPSLPGRAAQWFRWTYPSDVVAYAIASDTLYQLEANGTVYQADSGLTDAGTSFQQWLQFAVVSPGGVNGWARIHQIALACNVAAGTIAKVALGPEEGNYSLGTETHLSVGSGALQHLKAAPKLGKLGSITVWVGENAATATAGLTIDAITLLVGAKGGLRRVPTANRMTRST